MHVSKSNMWDFLPWDQAGFEPFQSTPDEIPNLIQG
jgi:hypothetical protein